MIRLAPGFWRRTGRCIDFHPDLIDTYARVVGATGITVYIALARYADPQTGVCPKEVAEIARVLALTPAQVARALQRLAAAGLIVGEESRAEPEPRA
jgi:DNA-binding MarR family transcriptional regulator